ncbi:Rdx family protein [Candidatus Pacearchaeota archaeon]|nr:Rdx family protein [Candidatus Pacearchaeota archaeon]
MASSLAASIKDKFGYRVELIEGHDGVFKVLLNEENIFDNKNDCSKLPTKEVLFQEIEKLN